MNIFYDEKVYELLDKIYSAVIFRKPEEQHLALEVFTELSKVIRLNELRGDYFLIHYALTTQQRIKLYKKDFPFKLTEGVLTSSLDVDIDRLISENSENFGTLLDYLGVNPDMTTAQTYAIGVSSIIKQTKQLFLDFRDIDSEVTESLETIRQLCVTLEEKFCQTCIINSSKILMGGIAIDKKFYIGVEGYKRFNNLIAPMLSERFGGLFESNKKFFSFDSMDAYKSFMKDNANKIKKICDFALEPLSERAHISNSDVVVLIADEGVGKTNFMIKQASTCTLSGKDVIIMTGESQFTKIIHMCISHFLFLTTGERISWKEIENCLELPERYQKLVAKATLDFHESPDYGRVRVVKEFTYEKFYTEAEDLILKYPNTAMIFIDHLDRLKSDGSLTKGNGYLSDDKKRIDHLVECEVDLSDEYPIAIWNLSHTSSKANELISRGKDIGVRSGANSGNSTKEADFVFVMIKATGANRGEFVEWQTKKVRDFSDNIPSYLLQKDFSCSNFVYREEYQYRKAVSDSDIEDEIADDDE